MDADEASYTMFSREARIVVLPAGNTWAEALERIGSLMSSVRDPAHSPPATLGQGRMPAHGRLLRTGRPVTHRRARPLGCPTTTISASRVHEYTFAGGSTNGATGWSLFIHVHQMRDRQHALVVTFLPAPFASAEGRIVLRGRVTTRVPPPDHWGAIEDFLDHLAAEPGAKEVSI